MAKGLSGQALARLLHYSQSGISRIESGRLRPSKTYVDKFAKALKLTTVEREELEEFTDAFLHSFYRSYWEKESVLSKFQDVIGRRERRALEIREFDWRVISGLLQTEEYARAIIRLATRQVRDKTIEAAVRGRIGRQKILLSRRKLVQSVMYEGALLTPILCPQGQIEQLEALKLNIKSSFHDIRILPQNRTWSVFPTDSFKVYDSQLVTVGTTTLRIELFEAEEIELYRKIFSQVFESALGGNSAIDLIDRAIDRIRSSAGPG